MKEQKNIAVILGDPRLPDRVKLEGRFQPEDFETVAILKQALGEIEGYRFFYIDDHKNFMSDLFLMQSHINFALNFCDEGFMNDPEKEMHIPVLLEVAQIPYSGAGANSMLQCYDKSFVKNLASKNGIAIANGISLSQDDCDHVKEFDKFPAIVKPNAGDGGYGILTSNVCNNSDELEKAVRSTLRLEGVDKVLVEEFLQGDDLTFGIIGNPKYGFLHPPILKDDYSPIHETGLPPIAGFDSKWDLKSPYAKVKSVRAELDEEVRKKIISGSEILFEALECRDYARFDWRLDINGNPRLLEVNPNPGWCWDGHLAKVSAAHGLSYSNMLEEIIHAAEKRLGLS